MGRHSQCLHSSRVSTFWKADGIIYTIYSKGFQICLPCTTPEERKVFESSGFCKGYLQLRCREQSDRSSINTVTRCQGVYGRAMN